MHPVLETECQMRYGLVEKVFVVTWRVEKVPTKEDLTNWFGFFSLFIWLSFLVQRAGGHGDSELKKCA